MPSRYLVTIRTALGQSVLWTLTASDRAAAARLARQRAAGLGMARPVRVVGIRPA